MIIELPHGVVCKGARAVYAAGWIWVALLDRPDNRHDMLRRLWTGCVRPDGCGWCVTQRTEPRPINRLEFIGTPDAAAVVWNEWPREFIGDSETSRVMIGRLPEWDTREIVGGAYVADIAGTCRGRTAEIAYLVRGDRMELWRARVKLRRLRIRHRMITEFDGCDSHIEMVRYRGRLRYAYVRESVVRIGWQQRRAWREESCCAGRWPGLFLDGDRVGCVWRQPGGVLDGMLYDRLWQTVARRVLSAPGHQVRRFACVRSLADAVYERWTPTVGADAAEIY